MELKNPFAQRNGSIITIADLTPDERGRKCRCMCPECKGQFIAVMGKTRQPHFRHDGEPCDSVKALMTALYRLLCDAVDENPLFTYPDCYGTYYGVPVQKKATIDDVRAAVTLMNQNNEDNDLIIKGKSFGVEKHELHSNAKGIPDAIILTDKVKHHQLAVALIPPPTFCKIAEPRPYQDIPTIAIHMGANFDLHHMKSDEVKRRLRDKTDDKAWVSSPTIESWLLKILARQHEYHEKYLAGEQARKEALAKRNEILNRMHEKNMQLRDCGQKTANAQAIQKSKMASENQNSKRTECVQNAFQFSEEQLKKKSQILKDKYPVIPSEKVLDDNGQRWCFCDTCHRWRPDTLMSSYGGVGDKVNRGLCSKCAKHK